MTAADLKVEGFLKICVTGDWGVGKTSLVLRWIDDIFTEEKQNTLGFDFKIKQIELDGKQYKVRVCDTAGQERFKTITSSYYRSAHGVIFVYDPTEQESFQNLSHWIDEVERYGSEGVNRIIVANKNDLPSAVITMDEAKKFCQKENIPLYETSAKTGKNVDTVFIDLIRSIIKRIEKPSQTTGTVKVDNSTSKPGKQEGCKC